MGKSKPAITNNSTTGAVTEPAADNVTPIRGKGDGKPARKPADTPAPVSAVEPALIIFGLDEGGKPHASWFGAADVELATKAAAMMGLKVLPVATPEVRARALELPAGRIFASGKGFVPFAKMAAYEALKACDGAFAPPPPPEPRPEPEIAVTGPAMTWAAIDVGALVLASNGEEDGWWPSLVAESKGDDIFVLKWVGFAGEPPIVRRRETLGLLPPMKAAEAADTASPPDAAA